MRKIVNGKRYDTEKAQLIHEWSNGAYYGDFAYCAEELYLTAQGAWFLYGEGGAFSRYASAASGGGRGAGWDIIPLSPQEALEWLEEHGAEADLIAECFPGIPEA